MKVIFHELLQLRLCAIIGRFKPFSLSVSPLFSSSTFLNSCFLSGPKLRFHRVLKQLDDLARKRFHLIVSSFVVAILIYDGLMFAIIVAAFVVRFHFGLQVLDGHFGDFIGLDHISSCVINPDSVCAWRKGYKNAFLYDTLFLVKITGKIVRGAGPGAGIGLSNAQCGSTGLALEFGVYATWVDLNGKRYQGAMSYSPRPTFDDMQPVLEVFVLDYSGDSYGEVATVELVRRIRDIKKFHSVEALKVQIQADVEEVRRLLLSPQ